MAIESVETLISTLLTASITGAGLVIAIYALITPLSSKIFKRRLETLRKRLRQFEAVKAQTTPEGVSKDAKILKTLAGEIRDMKTFPLYLGPLVLADFVFFALTAFFSMAWFIGNREETGVYPVIVSFGISVLLFILVGAGSIIDVYGSMKREFEQLKKEREAVEKAGEQLERFRLTDYAKKLRREREAEKRSDREDNDK